MWFFELMEPEQATKVCKTLMGISVMVNGITADFASGEMAGMSLLISCCSTELALCHTLNAWASECPLSAHR